MGKILEDIDLRVSVVILCLPKMGEDGAIPDNFITVDGYVYQPSPASCPLTMTAPVRMSLPLIGAAREPAMLAPAPFHISTTTGEHHTSTNTSSTMDEIANSTNEPDVVHSALFNDDLLDPVLRDLHHNSVFGADEQSRLRTQS